MAKRRQEVKPCNMKYLMILAKLNQFMYCIQCILIIIKLLDIYPVFIICPSNYPVFIVGSDWLSTKQHVLAVIDPLIGKWPIVAKGLDSIDRLEEMDA